MNVSINIYIGENATEYVDVVSKLRIQEFKTYPYLYKGNYHYEKNYIKEYTCHEQAMIAIARVDDEIVGVSTGIPINSDSTIVTDVRNVLSNNHIEINDYYYYGEIIILPKYRGVGIAKKLYAEQDRIIKTWGYKHSSILTVIRDENHPLKPNDYKSLDGTWKHFGFERAGLTINYTWPTIQLDNSVKDSNNTLEFWSKNLFKYK